MTSPLFKKLSTLSNNVVFERPLYMCRDQTKYNIKIDFKLTSFEISWKLQKTEHNSQMCRRIL